MRESYWYRVGYSAKNTELQPAAKLEDSAEIGE